MPQFTPPSIEQGPAALNRLHYRYRISRGITLLITGSTVTEVQFPSMDDLVNSDRFYQGGHVYTVSDSEASFLTTAGYGAGIS